MKTQREMAYLVSQYPAISHTFILREVMSLEQRGFRIHPYSVNEPDRSPERMTEAERQASSDTFYIKRQGVRGALTALVRTLLRRPLGLWRGLREAVRLSGTDLRRMAYHLAYLAEALIVGCDLDRKGIDHLHVHFATPAASVGLLVKVVFGTGFSFTLHGPDELANVAAYSLARKVELADFVICISHYAQSQLMQLSPVSHWSKFDVCRLGVDPDRFAPDASRVASDPFRILCVGRLTPAKGQHLVLDAAAGLLGSGRALQVTLVGQGPDMDSLRAHAERLGIASAVTFTGALNQDEILAHYRQADVFVLPSFAEGLPVVLMEAMALGIPCVTTHITGVPELIRNEGEGLLTAPSDLRGLQHAIGRLMDDASLREEISRHGRARILSDFTLTGSVENLARVFEERMSVAS